MKKLIYYVTSNPGKFAEASSYLEKEAPHLELKQFSADIPEIQTLDQLAIAVDKAKKAWELLRKPLIVDDSGIYFDKYYQFPGTLSKFVTQGLGFEGLKRIIDDGDRASYRLHMIYIDGPDSMHIFEAEKTGTLSIPEKLVGDPHLPYDSFFTADGATETNAMLWEKAADTPHLFYRLKALENFVIWHKKNGHK